MKLNIGQGASCYTNENKLRNTMLPSQLSHHLSEGSVREEPSPGRGRYDERYITLQSIGKGAFGFVKVGQRRSDGVKVYNNL